MRRAITVSGMVILFLLGTMAPSPQTSAVRRPSTQRKNTRATKVSPASMSRSQRFRQLFDCDEGGAYCADVATHKSYEGKYTGHDEPALLFYSNKPGSGNSAIFRLTLPTDPPTPPQQDGTGGTFNFQTQGAFWFSMALCDNESAPAPDLNHVCTPDSDANIWEGTDPTKPKFVGLHPGGAFMELQFYAPGWVTSADPTHWLAAMTIDSLNASFATPTIVGDFLFPTFNNADCLDTVGEEPLNFAFITRNGRPQGPPDPLGSIASDEAIEATFLPNPQKALFMNPGDHLLVAMHDSPAGFRVVIVDLTTRRIGLMTASAQNGFAQVLYQPTAATCSEHPYNFHPMYSTSSEATRVFWTAHALNVGFSSEIGHFEYCNSVDSTFNCTAAGVSEPDGMIDDDDVVCFDTRPGSPFFFGGIFVPTAGCIFDDLDFDSVSYGDNYPGSLADPVQDILLHGTPLQFTSLRFSGPGGVANYDRIAFESNIPGNETATFPPLCDLSTGNGCVNPPPGTAFYPIYTTAVASGRCVWEFGGANSPSATNTFGGNANAEFGPLITTNFSLGPFVIPIYGLYRQVLPMNPCPARP